MIAIGDIHGCSEALRRLIDEIAPQPEDTIVALGDYIDRGPDSRDVVEQMLSLQERCEVVHLLGNHELMLLIAKDHPSESAWWESVGGAETLQSYRDVGVENTTAQIAAETAREESDGDPSSDQDSAWPNKVRELIPQHHLEFFESCPLAYETDSHIFVHANYEAEQPIGEQNEEVLLWQHLAPKQIPRPHVSGKKAIVGHTPQVNGEILDLGHLVCIDTFCFGHGWLTALEVNTGQIWQADKHGELRTDI